MDDINIMTKIGRLHSSIWNSVRRNVKSTATIKAHNILWEQTWAPADDSQSWNEEASAVSSAIKTNIKEEFNA